MRLPQALPTKLAVISLFASLSLLTACTVKVNKSGEDDDGKSKNVDIETPVGGLHVRNDADANDIGIAVYPGARLKEKNQEGEQKSANVNVSLGAFGVKVLAMEYLTEDSPEKVAAYYKDQLKKFGSVLECRSNHHGADMSFHGDDKESDLLKCEGENKGSIVELKTGTRHNQHLVSIEPADNGKGTDFGLVYIRLRGKGSV